MSFKKLLIFFIDLRFLWYLFIVGLLINCWYSECILVVFFFFLDLSKLLVVVVDVVIFKDVEVL